MCSPDGFNAPFVYVFNKLTYATARASIFRARSFLSKRTQTENYAIPSQINLLDERFLNKDDL